MSISFLICDILVSCFNFLLCSISPPFTLWCLAGHSVWNCWVNNFLCCDHVILIFPLTRELFVNSKPICCISPFCLWSEFQTRDKCGQTIYNKCPQEHSNSDWETGWFTEKFLFDLTVINNEITKVNTPHLVVWILTCMDISGRKERGHMDQSASYCWHNYSIF